jgi:hypothetical protein
VNQADQIQVTRHHHEMSAARLEREQQFPIWHKRNCRRDDFPHNALRENSPRAGVMSLVPDITAGTGTEFEETLVYSGSGGLSQSEGAQERVLSVDEFLSEWDCGVR